LGVAAAKKRYLGEHVLLEPFKTASVKPDHVLAERPPDVSELGNPDGELPLGIFAVEDALANIYAGIADVNIRTLDEPTHFIIGLAAK